MLLDAGLLAPAGEDLRQTTRAPGALTLAGACVAFARARGPTRSRDAAIAHSPDFFAGLGLVARASGVSVGEISCRLLALGPDPHRPSVGKLSSEDYGASVGFRDDPREAFELTREPTSTWRPPVCPLPTARAPGRSSARREAQATDARARAQARRRREQARASRTPAILGSRRFRPPRPQRRRRLGERVQPATPGNIVGHNQFEHEVTLTDVGQYWRAAPRHDSRGPSRRDGPAAINEKTVNRKSRRRR